MSKKQKCIGMSKKALAILALIMVLACGGANALDYNDILLMRQNGIADEVIINMVQKSPGFVITVEQAGQLRAAGSSERLLAAVPVLADPSFSSLSPVVSSPIMSPEAVIVEDGSPITPVEVLDVEAFPSLYTKEGWLSISNQDWESYYLIVDQKAKRLFISRAPNGGMELESGRNRTLNIRKETYKIYGDSGRDLKIKVREGEVTRLSLVPFGVVGNSGLNGIVQDRERVNSERLFDNYVPPPAMVIVREPPVVVQEAPVIVVPGRPYHRPYYHGPRRGFYYAW